MKPYRVIFIIFILYYITEDKCSIFCVKLNKLQSHALINLKYPDLHNNYKDPNYETRSKRELNETAYNIHSKDLIQQIRSPRGATGSRRHLRVDDAHQVANYFLNNGPLRGHDHFVKERNCDLNKNENNIDETNNTTTEHSASLSVDEQNSNTNLPDAIVGATYDSASQPKLGAVPIAEPPFLFDSAASNLSSILHPALNTLTGLPRSLLGHDLLTSILHPNLHPHINALHDIPGTLLKTAALPVAGLMHARSELRNMLPKGPLLGSINKASPSNMIQSHPQPTGYIVRYVSHNKHKIPLSLAVGSSQLSNSNKEQDVTDPTNIKDEVTDENEQLIGKDQNENDNE